MSSSARAQRQPLWPASTAERVLTRARAPSGRGLCRTLSPPSATATPHPSSPRSSSTTTPSLLSAPHTAPTPPSSTPSSSSSSATTSSSGSRTSASPSSRLPKKRRTSTRYSLSFSLPACPKQRAQVNQTGDLASLDFLSPEQIALLPNLLALRDAIYSPQFRSFLRAVTGCGPLSGVKQDMSVNSYSRGCHLLNHDDVIATRRLSYILYMPLPHYHIWQNNWGGALELYSVSAAPDGSLEPDPIPVKSIPPSWNQFVFFEVQPGHSFHSVQEVVVGGDEDGRERLSISGWFHAAQECEEGYIPDKITPPYKSSREQLVRILSLDHILPIIHPPSNPHTSNSDPMPTQTKEPLQRLWLFQNTTLPFSPNFSTQYTFSLEQ